MTQETSPEPVVEEVNEDTLVEMDDDALEKHLDGDVSDEPVEDPEEETPEEDEPKEEPAEEPVEPEEKPEVKPDEETPEGYDKWTDNEKGLYWAKKKADKKAQEQEQRTRDYELELERMKAANEVQAKLMEKFKQRGKEESQPKGEYDKVLLKLQKADAEYMEQYGTNRPLTVEDQRALNTAMQIDNQRMQQNYHNQQAQTQKQQEYEQFVGFADKSETEYRGKLKSQGLDDYDHVMESFVKPIIMKELQRSGGKFSPTMYEVRNSANPGEEMYMSMLKSPEGRAYFQDRMKKMNDISTANKVLDGTKKVITTSAQASGGRGGDGRVRVTPQMANTSDKYLEMLTDDQLEALSEGKDVYLEE